MNHRIRSLDGLRAVAAIAVLAFHCRMPGALGGFVGVDVFFVLSGFVITAGIVQEIRKKGRFDLGWFYWRRFIRLCPALFLALSVYVAVYPEMLSDALQAAVYVTDYTLASWSEPARLSHTWSLGVEMKFYMLWPFVAIWLARMRDRTAMWALAGLFAALTLWRLTDLAIWRDWTWTYYRADARLTGLIAGAALVFIPCRPALRHGVYGLAVLAGAIWLLRWGRPDALVFGVTLVEIASAVVILHLAREEGGLHGFLSGPVFVYLGTISYGIYLWHYPVARVARANLDPYTATLVTFAVSVAAAALSWRYLEEPLLRRQRSRLAAA